uniref:Putative secreted protein n=1 Tax=Ixodes ricinus TaxID=34613 RepID=A0A6B0U938_IXORI
MAQAGGEATLGTLALFTGIVNRAIAAPEASPEGSSLPRLSSGRVCVSSRRRNGSPGPRAERASKSGSTTAVCLSFRLLNPEAVYILR